MLLGENRCGSLKGERGLIREVTLGKEGWLINQVGPPVPPDLYSTQEGHPSLLIPLNLIGDMSLTPGTFVRTPVQGGYRRYHSILSSPPPPDFSPGPLTPRFIVRPENREHLKYFRNVHGFPGSKALPCYQNFAHYFFVCFLFAIWRRTFMQNHCRLEEFINTTA